MTTKQQEFLDALKDPVQVSIKKACDEINSRGYMHGLRAVSVLYMEKYKAYVVAVLADTPDVLETTKDQFIWFFAKAVPGSMIKVSSLASSKPDIEGQYNIHYFIRVGPFDDTVTMASYKSKMKTDGPYFYCPYVPSGMGND